MHAALVSNLSGLHSSIMHHSSSTDGYYNIPSALGSATHGSLQVDGTIKALLVRISTWNITESATAKQARYTITMEITQEVGL